MEIEKNGGIKGKNLKKTESWAGKMGKARPPAVLVFTKPSMEPLSVIFRSLLFPLLSPSLWHSYGRAGIMEVRQQICKKMSQAVGYRCASY